MVTRSLVTRILGSRELKISVDSPLSTSAVTVLALAIWGSRGIHVGPLHKPTCVKKEFAGGSEVVDIFRS
jgi:hypothetical protein